MIPGIEHDFGGGRVYVIPPLTLVSLELMQDRISAVEISSAIDPGSIKTVIDVTYAALKRNYPDLTRTEVGELLDIGNFHEVMAKVLDVAGVMRKSQSAGERTPQPGSPSAG